MLLELPFCINAQHALICCAVAGVVQRSSQPFGKSLAGAKLSSHLGWTWLSSLRRIRWILLMLVCALLSFC